MALSTSESSGIAQAFLNPERNSFFRSRDPYSGAALQGTALLVLVRPGRPCGLFDLSLPSCHDRRSVPVGLRLRSDPPVPSPRYSPSGLGLPSALCLPFGRSVQLVLVVQVVLRQEPPGKCCTRQQIAPSRVRLPVEMSSFFSSPFCVAWRRTLPVREIVRSKGSIPGCNGGCCSKRYRYAKG